MDQVKTVDVFPQRETLANILSQSQGGGGSPYNLVVNLAKLGAKFPLEGVGLVGKDALGEYILADLKRHKIDARNIKVTPRAPTSYTDVMTEVDTGRRDGVTSDERARLKELERENRELRRANEILRKASAYFAQAELDRRQK